ncbi:MAG: histidine kinase [Defluviitaleaceae bacterium]|nr:histidine kinase [Defluviitaleaceae bacterium]
MKDLTFPKISFITCKLIGFSLLVAHWLTVGDTMGFFIMMSMVCMALLRWRIPKLSLSVIVDVSLCIIFFPLAGGLALFSAMYYRKYWAAVALVTFFGDVYIGAIAALCGLAGFFLSRWEKERMHGLSQLDKSAGKYYEAERLQNELQKATVQIERMTLVSERARIAREIHDNAGHEIVAAYMSLQTARLGIENADTDALELYDAALGRLDAGANKIREAVHNLAPVTSLGVEALQETCARITSALVSFKAFGDTSHVPVYIWGVLESCLNEAITNATRHARPKTIMVHLDVTQKLVRLSIENDVNTTKKYAIGNGLRNLRYRAASVGGNLAIDSGNNFRVVCVIPIRKEANI